MATDSGGDIDFINPMTGQHQLAHGALGMRQVLFCSVTGAAPIAAMLFNTPVAILGVGWATPAAFLIATIVLTIFSVGYIEMARKVTAAGGFYSFISHAMGNVLGMGTALLMAFCYLVFSGAVTGVTSYFAVTTIEAWTGVSIPVWVFLFGTIIVMAALTFFHIALPARILGVDAGTLAPGSVADVCLYAPDQHWQVLPGVLASQGKNTPFLGYEVSGAVALTLVAGQVAYERS